MNKKFSYLLSLAVAITYVCLFPQHGEAHTSHNLFATLGIPTEAHTFVQALLVGVLCGLFILLFIAQHHLKRLKHEIKRRQQTEASLHICDSRFEAMVKHAPTCILLYDTSQKLFIEANPKAVEVLGYSRDTLCTMSWLDIATSIQKNDVPSDKFFNTLLAPLLNHSHHPVREQVSLQTKDSSSLCVDLILNLLPGDDPPLIRASFFDITSQILAAKKLKENEERYRLLFEEAHDPMLLLDKNTLNIEAANTAAVYMTGQDAEKLQTLTLVDISASLKKNDSRLDAIRCCNNDSCPIELWHFRNTKGATIPTEITARSFSSMGDEKIILSIRDISNHIKADEALKGYRKRLQKLTDHLQRAREEERTRVAREVHDELGQVLSALKMDMHRLQKKIGHTTKLDNMVHTIEEAIKSVQRICTNLRPTVLDHLGPGAAILWLVMEAEKRSGLTIKTEVDPEKVQPSHDVATALFRIVQECLTNIIRHANATEVLVRISVKGEKIFFEIDDNGSGFELYKVKKQKKFGLTSLRERTRMFHGDLQITTEPGKGTQVAGWLPTHYEEEND